MRTFSSFHWLDVHRLLYIWPTCVKIFFYGFPFRATADPPTYYLNFQAILITNFLNNSFDLYTYTNIYGHNANDCLSFGNLLLY